MPDPTHCPKCGAELPADATDGLCPQCLLVVGLEDSQFSGSNAGESGSSAPTTADADPPPLGTKVKYVGDYELLEEIARGGMGVVYKARQLSLNRKVALKMILAGQLAGEADLQRFRAEAEAAANLDHPGIVPIFEVGEHEGQHYFSMAHVDGQTLASNAAGEPLPPNKAAELIKKVATAVAYAHTQGVVHRDLKPANVIVDKDGEPRITDFGLAKRAESDSELTATGQILGTPSYMSPEQAAGKRDEIGAASDIYALGAMLYNLLTGRPPLQGETPLDTLKQVLDDEPPPPRRLNPRLPRDLETICMKCLQKQPRSRYESAQQLADDLDRFLRGEPIRARRAGPLRRTAKWVKRRPALAAMMLAVVVATTAGITAAIWQSQRTETARVSLEQNLYVKRVADAQHAFLTGNLDHGDRVLDECQPEHRNWEWHYLKRLCHPLRHSVKLDSFKALAFSPDGQTIAIANEENSIKFMDVATAQEVFTLSQTRPIKFLVYSADGRNLATISDGTSEDAVSIWDLETRMIVRRLDGRGDPLACSPDARRMASKVDDDTIAVWNPLTGEDVAVLDNAAPFRYIWLSQNVKRLVSQGGRSPTIWDVDAGKALVWVDGDGIWTFDFEGNRFVGNDAVWDANTGDKLYDLPFASHWPNLESVTFTPDGKRLILGDINQHFTICDAASGMKLFTLDRLSNDIGSSVRLFVNPTSLCLASVGGEFVDGKQIKNVRLGIWDAGFVQPEVVYAGQGLPVDTVLFSPDSQFVASVSGPRKDDRHVVGPGKTRVWRPASLQPVLSLGANKIDVCCVAASPDGKLVAVGSIGNSVQLWDTSTGKKRITLSGHTAAVRGVAFGPQGNRIVTASDDKTIKLWDVKTGVNLRTFVGHKLPLLSVAYSPDGKLIASSAEAHSGSGQIRAMGVEEFSDSSAEAKVWDANTGRELFTVQGGLSVAFSADSSQLATIKIKSSDGETTGILIWDSTTGELVSTVRDTRMYGTSLSWSHDGKRIAVGIYNAYRNDYVAVWDVGSGDQVFGSQTHGPSEMVRMALSDDGQCVAYAGVNGRTVNVHWLNNGQTATFDAHKDIVRAMTFIPGTQRLVTAGQDETIHIWDTTTRQELSAVYVDGEAAHAAAWHPIKNVLATACWDNTIRIWEMESGKPPQVLRGHKELIRSVAWSPDGGKVASASDDGSIRIWDAVDGKQLFDLRGHKSKVQSVAWNPRGDRLASISAQGAHEVWDATNGNQVGSFFPRGARIDPRYQEVFVRVPFSPNGRWLAKCADEGRREGLLQIWDVESGKEIITQRGDERPTTRYGRFAWSPDGNRLAARFPATISQNDAEGRKWEREVDTVAIWNLNTKSHVVMNGQHDGYITSVDFSPDGKRVVSASEDKTIKLWDVVSGLEVLTIRAFDAAVLDVAFSRDGHRIAASCSDGTTKILDATPIE